MTALTATPWGTNIIVEVSSAEPDADPVWVDISQWVIVPYGATLDTWLGRVTELEAGEDGHGSWQLNNNDERFTPGNPTSPYNPWWKQRRRVRVREIVGYLGFDLADGYLEIPETQIRAQPADGTSQDIVLSVAFVDVMTRVREMQEFVSNLGAHIKRYASGLVAYWPMTEAGTPFASIASTGTLPAQPTTYYLNWGLPTAATGSPAVNPASQDGPAGEDVSFVGYEMEVTTVGGLLRPNRSMQTVANIPNGTITLAAGQVMTVVAWVRSPWSASDSESIPLNVIFTDSGGTGALTLAKQDGAGSTWLVEVTGSTTLSASFTGPVAPTDRWTLVGIRFGYNPNTIEFWVDDSQTTGTLSGAAPTTLDVDSVAMPDGRFDGSIAHVQVYVGAATDWTFANQFTAQREMGLYGLEQQTTGERINTILDLIGFPAGRRDIDTGVSIMQRAALGGARPAEALERARETEQGRLFAAAGRVTFHDRSRINNI